VKLLIRWAITSFALFVAAWIVPGIRVEGNGWPAFAVMAIMLGLLRRRSTKGRRMGRVATRDF
jgi:uncharacterized membrane protein YvlD (DUF360 family)